MFTTLSKKDLNQLFLFALVLWVSGVALIPFTEMDRWKETFRGFQIIIAILWAFSIGVYLFAKKADRSHLDSLQKMCLGIMVFAVVIIFISGVLRLLYII